LRESRHGNLKNKKKKTKKKDDSSIEVKRLSFKKLTIAPKHNDKNKKGKNPNANESTNLNKKKENEEKEKDNDKEKDKEKEQNKDKEKEKDQNKDKEKDKNNVNKSIDFLDDDFLEKNRMMRGRGKSEYSKKNGTVFCFKGILSKNKKKTKKGKVKIKEIKKKN
jgi:hypothetical protein